MQQQMKSKQTDDTLESTQGGMTMANSIAAETITMRPPNCGKPLTPSAFCAQHRKCAQSYCNNYRRALAACCCRIKTTLLQSNCLPLHRQRIHQIVRSSINHQLSKQSYPAQKNVYETSVRSKCSIVGSLGGRVGLRTTQCIHPTRIHWIQSQCCVLAYVIT